jgi:argininosuccinate lyase
MAKLWAKNYDLDEAMEAFTVGEDYVLDLDLVEADVLGSIAHAKMLSSIGILSADEFAALKRELVAVLESHERDEFRIPRELEDVHTAVENVLTERIGDAAKRLHTARSRNDQVLVDTRYYTRARLLDIAADVVTLAETLAAFARTHADVPMPGRTHTQPAMPSSVGLWAAAFAESLLDDRRLLQTAYDLGDQCPLGSAAGYGVALPIDRQMTSDLLGFAKPQSNVLYAGNSRGKMESVVLYALVEVGQDLAKLATDVIGFSTPEFGYFTLPDRFCTGSSIMPQKKNADPMELVRAKCSTLEGYLVQLLGIRKALPSGYNRDFQETKAPLMRGLAVAQACVRATDSVMGAMEVDVKRLEQSFRPELYAADEALDMAAQGVPFREAYKQVGLNLDKLAHRDPRKNILSKTHIGATGNLGLDGLFKALETERKRMQAEGERLREVRERLLAL